MQKYNKLIIALVGAAVAGANIYFNSPQWVQMLIPLLTAAGVYQVKNKEA